MSHKKKRTVSETKVNEQIVPGTTVETEDGYLGQVEQVFMDQAAHSVVSILVRVEGQPELLSIPATLIVKNHSQGKVLLNVKRVELLAQINQPNQVGTGSELRIPLVEEKLTVDKRLVQLGEVLVHKTVEHSEEVTNLPLSREELEIVREPVNNEPLDKPLENHYEGDWLVIPVMQEVVVVKKQLVLVENIRIRKHQVVEDKEIRAEVLRERVDIENTATNNQVTNIPQNNGI